MDDESDPTIIKILDVNQESSAMGMTVLDATGYSNIGCCHDPAVCKHFDGRNQVQLRLIAVCMYCYRVATARQTVLFTKSPKRFKFYIIPHCSLSWRFPAA